MSRFNIDSGSEFEEKIGYSRAVIVGEWIIISGTTGYDYSKMTISNDVVEQAKQTIVNIERALLEANCSFSNIVKVTYIFPNPEDFEKCWSVLKSSFGNVKPAATMFSARLANDNMKIEIEVWARK